VARSRLTGGRRRLLRDLVAVLGLVLHNERLNRPPPGASGSSAPPRTHRAMGRARALEVGSARTQDRDGTRGPAGAAAGGVATPGSCPEPAGTGAAGGARRAERPGRPFAAGCAPRWRGWRAGTGPPSADKAAIACPATRTEPPPTESGVSNAPAGRFVDSVRPTTLAA
jgi:hypothetical protein